MSDLSKFRIAIDTDNFGPIPVAYCIEKECTFDYEIMDNDSIEDLLKVFRRHQKEDCPSRDNMRIRKYLRGVEDVY